MEIEFDIWLEEAPNFSFHFVVKIKMFFVRKGFQAFFVIISAKICNGSEAVQYIFMPKQRPPRATSSLTCYLGKYPPNPQRH